MNIQKGKCINHALYEEANNAHERALVFMHKMPRIWIDYGEFLMRQESFTQYIYNSVNINRYYIIS